MKRRFKRAFAPNKSPKHDLQPALDLAIEVVFASNSPVYDASMDDKSEVGKDIELVMSEFDPATDVIIDSGDPVLLVMMVMYLADRFNSFHFARFNVRAGRYVTTLISHAEVNQIDAGGEEIYDD